MMTLISAVTTSVIINVTTILIATAVPVKSSSSSSDLLAPVPNPNTYKKQVNAIYVQ